MKRFVLIMAISIAAMVSASAQKNIHNTVVKEYEYESFASVRVSDDFIVKLSASDKFITRTIVDKRLASFVKTYVQNGTLNVTLDRKSFPSDLKKALRGKGTSAPILEVEISFPTLKSLEMNDNTILHRADVISSDAFTLILNDKARVDKLSLDCETAELNLYKSAYADVEALVDKNLYVVTSNSSKIVVRHTGDAVKIDAAGSSMVDAVLDVRKVEVVSSGSASTKLISGKVGEISVDITGSAKVDAESVSISKGSMLMAGSSKCYTNVSDTLKVNLTGNSMLTFKNKPYIDVERIVGSTLIKADDPKRK